MATVAYNTKTNNTKVKKLLDNPAIGREIVKELVSHNIDFEKDANGNLVNPFIIVKVGSKEFKLSVKELISK